MLHPNPRTPRIRTELITPPVEEPLTLAEAKTYLRVTSSTEDALITALIVAARTAVERYLGVALLTQTLAQWEGLEDRAGGPWWSGTVEAPRTILSGSMFTLQIRPATAVTEVAFYDEADAATVASPTVYQVDLVNPRFKARIALRRGQVWPMVVPRPLNAVKITYTAGFAASAATLPGDLRTGVLQALAYLYEHRGDCAGDTCGGCGPTAGAILRPYRHVDI